MHDSPTEPDLLSSRWDRVRRRWCYYKEMYREYEPIKVEPFDSEYFSEPMTPRGLHDSKYLERLHINLPKNIYRRKNFALKQSASGKQQSRRANLMSASGRKRSASGRQKSRRVILMSASGRKKSASARQQRRRAELMSTSGRKKRASGRR